MLFASMETKLLTGIVQSGGPGSVNVKALPNVPVTVYEATDRHPLPVGTATTDAEGRFELHMERDKSERIFYASAAVREGVRLVTIIGSELQDDKPAWTITINELTTVAAAFSMAQFIKKDEIGGDAFGLRIASMMNDNLASPGSGASSEVLLKSPNSDETNSLRSTRSLANLLAACVRDVPNALANLFALTTPPHGGTAPTNTFEAMVNIARYPSNNVHDIFKQSRAVDVYSPALKLAPDAWTIAVKVNDSGSDQYLIAGPGNIALA